MLHQPAFAATQVPDTAVHLSFVLAARLQTAGVGLTLQAVRNVPPVDAQAASSVEPVGALVQRMSVQTPLLSSGSSACCGGSTSRRGR